MVRVPEMTCRLASPIAASQPLMLGATYGTSLVLFIVIVRLPYSKLHVLLYKRVVGGPDTVALYRCSTSASHDMRLSMIDVVIHNALAQEVKT